MIKNRSKFQRNAHILLTVIIFFIVGYVAIAFEHKIRVNKTAIALLIAVFCWDLISAYEYYMLGPKEYIAVIIEHLNRHLHDIAQIIFFFMGAMTVGEGKSWLTFGERSAILC